MEDAAGWWRRRSRRVPRAPALGRSLLVILVRGEKGAEGVAFRRREAVREAVAGGAMQHWRCRTSMGTGSRGQEKQRRRRRGWGSPA